MKTNITANGVINIRCTSSKLWAALTTPDIIKQYFFGTETITDWQEGSPIVFKGEWDGKPYEDKGTILIVVKERLFRYDYWSSMSGLEDIPENYQVITYELFEEGGVSTLTVTQENIPDQTRKVHSEQTWRAVLSDLKDLLEATDEEDTPS